MTEKNEMNKQQALEKLAALEAETKALRAIIEAPEPKPNVVRDLFITAHVAIWNHQCPNLRLTFSGKTGGLIKAEVLK